MTVDNLIQSLKQYPPHMKVFAYNAKGEIQELESAEILLGNDQVWHEEQTEDVLFIS